MNIRIKNILILLLSVTITYSCNNSESNNYMSVSGKINSAPVVIPIASAR